MERREDQSTRPDQAQLARDFKIALPYEMDTDQRRALVHEFARELAQKGMVLDVAVHAPDLDDDPRNFHVHVLATMRDILPEGFGKKVREWNRDTQLEQWKDRWSELGAEHLERAGFELEAERFRVGHMTLQKQREAALQRGDYEWAESLDRTPQKHMGPHATAMENRGIDTTKGDQNREIEERNEQRARMRDLSRTEGEIRLAYQLTDRAQAFADALEDRGLILARVAARDLEKLATLDKRRFEESAAEHQRKMQYYDRRIAEEGSNPEKVAELERRRENFENKYLAGLPWTMREGGVDELTPVQRTAAQRSFDQWQHKNRHSFGDYVSYVQQQCREQPAHRSRFQEGELVVVNHYGDVYPLTQRNTGEDPKLLRRYLREVDTAPLLNVSGAWAVFRSLHDHRREEGLWAEREKVWPINLPEQTNDRLPSRLSDLDSPSRWFHTVGQQATNDHRPLDAPEELNRPRSTRFPEQPDAARIWEAYNRNRHEPEAFANALDEHGILLCAASKMEADHSYRRALFSREIDHYSPAYREGEILAMGFDARVYKLNSRVTGADQADLDRFLARLDKTHLPTIGEATQKMHERAEAREAGAQLMSILNPVQRREFDPSLALELRRLTRQVRHVISEGLESAERPLRAVGKVLEFGAKAFESLFAPVLSPEQKLAGVLAERTRQSDAEEAERHRQNLSRER